MPTLLTLNLLLTGRFYSMADEFTAMHATLQVKVFAWSPFDNQLFWFRETFSNQVASSKILGAMATKLVAT